MTRLGRARAHARGPRRVPPPQRARLALLALRARAAAVPALPANAPFFWLLAHGSFGLVLQATDRKCGVDVAIKISKSKKPFVLQARPTCSSRPLRVRFPTPTSLRLLQHRSRLPPAPRAPSVPPPRAPLPPVPRLITARPPACAYPPHTHICHSCASHSRTPRAPHARPARAILPQARTEVELPRAVTIIPLLLLTRLHSLEEKTPFSPRLSLRQSHVAYPVVI
jgi:hypothetical protein